MEMISGTLQMVFQQGKALLLDSAPGNKASHDHDSPWVSMVLIKLAVFNDQFYVLPEGNMLLLLKATSEISFGLHVNLPEKNMHPYCE